MSELSKIKYSNPVSSFTMKHDKVENRFIIDYNSAIMDTRSIVSDKYNTIFDANIGTICDFIKKELKSLEL